MDELQQLVRKLRAPDGCPWDRKQTLASVRAYLLEEAHEAADAIDRIVEDEASDALREELGDLLFQVAFVGVLAEERGDFQLADAIRGVHRKMVDRHPHVFGDEFDDGADGAAPADAAEVARRWETRKAANRPEDVSILDGVPRSLPSLVAAYRLGQKAGGVGFDWPDLQPVLAKVREELAEVEAEIGADIRTEIDAEALEHRRRVEAEIGDLLFAVSNLARHLDVDPEAALARTNTKFRRRFCIVEAELRRRDVALGDAPLEDMDALWDAAKDREKS